MKLSGKVALVTGGSSGIGRAIAVRFLKEGANVIVFDLKKPPFQVGFHKVDLRDESRIREGFSKIRKLDILVNNAGIYFQRPVEKTSEEELDMMIGVNLKGVYLMCKHALPLLLKSKGCVINVSSGLSVAPEPESPAYCATKAAVSMLTKCMTLEYAPRGVRINAILPGPIDTPLLRKAFPSEKDIKRLAELNPMKRAGKPEDVANVALFLASEEAGYVTGGIYTVDGGESVTSAFSV
jgi:NAD(P)-dependent dehydrogenase (short-subunit alcohol dehydrogenase family)